MSADSFKELVAIAVLKPYLCFNLWVKSLTPSIGLHWVILSFKYCSFFFVNSSNVNLISKYSNKYIYF